VDEEITVMGRKVKIIGVFKKEGESMVGNSSDDEIVVPVNYARTLVDLKSERIQPMIMVKGREGVSNYELIEELRGIMRSIRKLHPREEDSFALNQASLISAGLDSIFSVINKAGWLIGIFSILVGGFGIANIMFVSVKERTHIIGIQKSLGAKNYFILLQFLSESVILCLIGGMIGLFVVFLGTLAANAILDAGVGLTEGNIFLGLFVSAIIGVISGFIPAYTASQMDPVEAIRTN
jgi:putative ABC transport system permease protein